MRVVFMGTPDIAATCLKKIIADGFEVVAVYTQPDRPKGRGMKLVQSPVKELALQQGLPVFQPESFRDDDAVEQLCALRPDVVAVVAYGRILPQRVLDIPRLGCVNIHASILPAYRGSAPYQWAVLDGCAETGVTAQFMSKGVDEGDIIDIAKTDIGENETAGQLLERLAVLGAALLSKVLTRFTRENVVAVPQNNAEASFAPMLDKSICPIDWSKTARQIHNQVRGLHPWPVATMELKGQRFKIHETRVLDRSGAPGEILELTKTGLVIACGEGAVEIRQLQAEGGKRMAAPDYFRGHPL
jgi:methionyl-tRNA formyltransferase